MGEKYDPSNFCFIKLRVIHGTLRNLGVIANRAWDKILMRKWLQSNFKTYVLITVNKSSRLILFYLNMLLLMGDNLFTYL